MDRVLKLFLFTTMAALAFPLIAQDNLNMIIQMKFAEGDACTELNPYKAPVSRAVNNRVYAVIFEPLVRFDFDTDEIVPVLAETWDKTSDNRRLTLHLRNNVRWHYIEKKFSAHDVKFTFDYIRNMAEGESDRRKYLFIERIAVVDSFTVTFYFNTPEPDALLALDAWMIPKSRFTENFIEIEDADNNLSTFSKKPIGTGPFKFVRQGVDRNIDFVKNITYWGQPSQIHHVKDSYIPDDETRVNALLFGGQDLLTETTASYISRISNAGGFRMDPYQSYSFDAIAYNCNNPLLRDPLLRKAMTIAIDRQQILDQWYAGKGSLIHGPVVPYSPIHNSSLHPLPFDPEMARTLLTDAGYIDSNGDGVRERSGQPLRFTILAPVESAAQSTEIQNVVLSVVNYLKEVGIQLEQENVIHGEYYKSLYREHDFDMSWVKFGFGTSYDISVLFHSEENFPGGYNIGSYRNADVDRLFNEYARSSDRFAKYNLMQEVQGILREECPFTFLYTVDNFAAYNRDLVNIRIDPFYFFTFIAQWIKH